MVVSVFQIDYAMEGLPMLI